MKMNKIFFTILLPLAFLIACDKKDSKIGQKPMPISNVTFEPVISGAIIYYNLPEEESIHFVKAEYVLTTGEKITRASSYFASSLKIDGFNDTDEHEVKLYSVNFNGDVSDPVIIRVNALGSYLNEIAESLKILPNFSSAKLLWDNNNGTWSQIFLEITNKDRTVLQTVSSTKEGSDFLWVKNLSSEKYDFVGYVRDKYGNESKKINLGSLTPYVDYKIEKTLWNYIPNDELPTGKRNSDIIFQEGRITKFWDDIIDDRNLANLNFFVSSRGYPFSYFIDLGRTIKCSKVKVWQREENWQYNPYYYLGQNVKTFELWISKDKINWERIRRATILKPENATVAIEEAKAGHEFLIYEDDPRFTSEFRYLEFRGIEAFGDPTYGCLSEITLFGIEQNDF